MKEREAQSGCVSGICRQHMEFVFAKCDLCLFILTTSQAKSFLLLLLLHPPPPGCSFSSFSLFPFSFFLLLYLASLWSQQEPGCISEHHPSVIASCFVNFRQTGSFTFLACIFEMEKRRVQVPSSASCQKMRMVLRLLQAD